MHKTLLFVFAISGSLEMLIETKVFWIARKYFSYALIITILIWSVATVVLLKNFWAALILFLSLYRVINLLRIVSGRTEAKFLIKVALHSSIFLISCQVLILILDLKTNIPSKSWLYALLCIAAVTVFTLLRSSLRNFKKTVPRHFDVNMAQRDFPSISVAIPARNESEDLIKCLDTLIASDYPKLEIVVLDDCSQNKHTPKIIKGYAQQGVKFLAGSEPPKNWHAKTYAYKQLADQVNGEYILFCGVDTRFDSHSLTLMVKELLGRKKLMISFLPVNKFNDGTWLENILLQPSRYFWELALPRRTIKRPPVLSTCWLIKSSFLKSLGGFAAVERNVVPESYFAKNAIKKDGYSFLQSANIFGLSSDKLASEQLSTALRTRYPQMHRRPELVGLLSLFEILLLAAPLLGIVFGIIDKNLIMLSVSLVIIYLLNMLYFDYVKLTYHRNVYASFLIMPIALLADIFLLNYSMYKYEFSEVVWKDRNICLPVMYANLPTK